MAARPTGPWLMRGLLHPAVGPLVRVRVLGPNKGLEEGLGLLDTGASASAVDRRIAERLGLPEYGSSDWHGITGGGERERSSLRLGKVRVGDHPWLWELRMIELPSLGDAIAGAPIVVILGWDFLVRCKLVTDGPGGSFTLEMPDPGRQPVRR